MIAAIFQVVPSTWPNLLRPHPYAVGGFAVCGALMFAYAALSAKQPQAATSTNHAERDNTGQQIVAPHSTINIHHAPTSSGASHSDTGDDSEDEFRFTVSVERLRVRVVKQFPSGLFKETTEGGSPHAFIQISNHAPGRTLEAGVSLRFISGGSEIHRINRTFWLANEGNRTTLELESSQLALLGCCKGRTWTAFQNDLKYTPVRFASNVASWRARMEKPLVRGVSFPFEAKMLVEVRVIAYPLEQVIAMSRYALVPDDAQGFTLIEENK